MPLTPLSNGKVYVVTNHERVTSNGEQVATDIMDAIVQTTVTCTLSILGENGSMYSISFVSRDPRQFVSLFVFYIYIYIYLKIFCVF